MTETRAATLHAYLGYRDAQAAIDWLVEAIGFELTMAFPDGNGGIAHAELRLDDAAITLFSDREGYERPARKGDTGGIGLYLVVAEPAAVDAIYDSCVAAGATVIWKAEASEWNYRCRVVDPQGVEWTVGTYRPGEHY